MTQGASCTFTQPTVTMNGSPASTTLTITTTARTVTTASAGHGLNALAATGTVFFGLVLVGGFSSRKRRVQLVCVLLLAIAMIVGMKACGGGSHTHQQQFVNGTPAGTYMVNVASNADSVTNNVTIKLVVQ